MENDKPIQFPQYEAPPTHGIPVIDPRQQKPLNKILTQMLKPRKPRDPFHPRQRRTKRTKNRKMFY